MTEEKKPNELNFGLDYEAQMKEQEKKEKQIMGVRTKFGAGDFPIIKKGGQWLDYWEKLLPDAQFGAKLESMGCTGFGTANNREMQVELKYNIKEDVSDRALNEMAGTTESGNTVDAPVDTLRKKGYLLEHEWGWNKDTFDWKMFYSPIETKKLALALSRALKWDIKHEYVPKNPTTMCASLETSVLGATVYAWLKDSRDGLYKDYGYRQNHYSNIIGYDWGRHWICGDQYPENYDYNSLDPKEYIKKLDWNYNFGCLKRYSFKLRPNEEKKCLLLKFKNMIIEAVKMNFYKDKKDPSKGLASGEVFITKEDPKRRKPVKTIDDVIAMIEVIFANLDIHLDKTDWGEIGQYTPVDRF